jgi:exopolyphosphatase/guanosine-5'-triphosphate,3'-diphosphate pyrophosphatase
VTRVAAVDLGTNSTRLLVADVEDGIVEPVLQRLRITRLGEGVDARRRLLPVPIARARNCLSDYRRELEALGAERTLLVATSAVRDAENGDAFLGEIEWSYGFATRLLSGEEEAALTFRGATHDREAAGSLLVLDIGGGSTELIAGTGGDVSFRVSIDAGSVRMTERFLASDPPAREELEACARAVRSLLAERVPEDLDVEHAVGVAGTVTSIAALDLGLYVYDRFRVHGHRLRPEDVARQLERLAALPLDERRAVPALDPERAPVIVAGAIVLREAMAYLGLDELEASEHDLLFGAALEAAELPEAVEGDAPPGAFTCC